MARALGAHGKTGLLIAAAAALPWAGGCSALSDNALSGPGGSFDAAVADGSVTGPFADASSCQPGNVATFLPASYRPAATSPGACNAAQISDYYDDCLATASASPTTCNAFVAQSAACAACILTPSTASGYGPLVTTGPLVQRNVAGCVELAEPSLLSCAKAEQAAWGCELAACAANCPIAAGDNAALAAYSACALEADATGCRAYTTAAACGAADVDGADGAVQGGCSATAFEDFYFYAVPIFCGPPVFVDAGAGAADAAMDAGGASDASPPRLDAGSTDAASADATVTRGDGGDDASDATDATDTTDVAADSAPADAGPAAEDGGPD